MISRTSSAAPRATAPLRVLLVENHADTREFLTSMLEGLGYTVIVAASMANALRAAARSGCDVLISDIGLPDGDGWELLNRLNLPRPMYAIAMSGYGTYPTVIGARPRAIGTTWSSRWSSSNWKASCIRWLQSSAGQAANITAHVRHSVPVRLKPGLLLATFARCWWKGGIALVRFCPLDARQNLGGQGRNRTTDTRIFSPLLYQLSYLACCNWTAVDACKFTVAKGAKYSWMTARPAA